MLALQFTEFGLPAEHGIEIHVAEDGQEWWGGRRTTTGWYFAIGSAGPPYDEWFYDGADEPPGYPEPESWSLWAGGSENAVNWE